MAINGNLLPYNTESVETDISGWTAGGNTTAAQSTAHALDGTHSLALTSTASGTTSAFVSSRVTGVNAAGLYACYFWLFSTVQVSAFASVDWYTATTYISTTTGTTVTVPANAWTQVGSPMVAVATTQQCVPIIDITATAGSQVFYCDEMFFGPWINPVPPSARQAVKRSAYY